MKSFFGLLLKIIGILFAIAIFYIGVSIALSFTGKYNNQELGKTLGSQFVLVDGKKMAYRYTPSQRRSYVPSKNILMIHGFAAWGKTWIDQEKLLSEKGYDVYTLDLPPFGFTDVYPDMYFSREKQAELIEGFIRELSLKDIILFAHSYGGKAALEAYMKNPKVFSGMVLIDVALGFPQDPHQVFSPPGGVAGYIGTHPFLRSMIMRFVITNTFIGKKALESFLYDKNTLTKERLEIYKEPFVVNGKGEYMGDWISYITLHQESGLSTHPENYHQINIPVQIIWGKEDTITPINQGRELQRMIANSLLSELDHVNHIPQIEGSDKVNQIISEFLTKNF
ncbi:alpha/beta hydrolase [Candidatus Gracilibacteria bacterium]|nr:alpha/beta hydrolase [Candidatus Gracilibacteria bacterium]